MQCGKSSDDNDHSLDVKTLAEDIETHRERAHLDRPGVTVSVGVLALHTRNPDHIASQYKSRDAKSICEALSTTSPNTLEYLRHLQCHLVWNRCAAVKYVRSHGTCE